MMSKEEERKRFIIFGVLLIASIILISLMTGHLDMFLRTIGVIS